MVDCIHYHPTHSPPPPHHIHSKADSTLNTTVFSLLASLVDEELHSSAFAFWKLLQASHTGIILFCALGLSFNSIAAILLVFVALGVGSILALQRVTR